MFCPVPYRRILFISPVKAGLSRAGSLSHGSRRACLARTAVSKRSAQSRTAQVYNPLQAVPQADRERSAVGRFSTLQAAPLHT